MSAIPSCAFGRDADQLEAHLLSRIAEVVDIGLRLCNPAFTQTEFANAAEAVLQDTDLMPVFTKVIMYGLVRVIEADARREEEAVR